MLKYIAKRLLIMLLVLWAVSTMTYFMVHVTPGDAATAIVFNLTGGTNMDQELIDRINKRFDLDKPVYVQYFNWLLGVFRLDFGISYRYNMPVMDMIKARLPNTARLGLTAVLLSALIGIPLGVLSALRQNKILDHVSRVITLFIGSVPGFLSGLVLIIIFSLKFKWFPTSGMKTAGSIVLPAVTLALGMVATTTRMMRTGMLDVLRQDFMVVAKAKGIRRSSILTSHAFRNALPSIVTVIGLQIGHILGGSVLVETIFAWPGLGSLLNDAVSNRDTPMLEGCVILITFGYTAINLLVDIVYAWLDPRVKYTEG